MQGGCLPCSPRQDDRVSGKGALHVRLHQTRFHQSRRCGGCSSSLRRARQTPRDRLGDARQIEREGDPARLRHRHQQRSAAARSGTGRSSRAWSATPTTAASDSSKPPRRYHGMAEMLAIALKGLPRDSYRLMTKYGTPPTGDPAPKIDLFRQQLGPNTSTSCCCTACARRPGRPITKACRTASRRRRARR